MLRLRPNRLSPVSSSPQLEERTLLVATFSQDHPVTFYNIQYPGGETLKTTAEIEQIMAVVKERIQEFSGGNFTFGTVEIQEIELPRTREEYEALAAAKFPFQKGDDLEEVEYNRQDYIAEKIQQEANKVASENDAFVKENYRIYLSDYYTPEQQRPDFTDGYANLNQNFQHLDIPPDASFEDQVNAILHELGHSFNFVHASSALTDGTSPFGASGGLEYGNRYDVMGSGFEQKTDYGADDKLRAGWITGKNKVTVDAATLIRTGTSKTYSLAPFDTPTLSDDEIYLLQFPTQGKNDYYLSYRSTFGGLELEVAVPRGGFQDGILLDADPTTAEPDLLQVGDEVIFPGGKLALTFQQVQEGKAVVQLAPPKKAAGQNNLA